MLPSSGQAILQTLALSQLDLLTIFGHTLDELLEVLTLVQTGKVGRLPIVLVGREFWRRAVNFDFLVKEGMISAADAALASVVETAEDAVAILRGFYHGVAP